MLVLAPVLLCSILRVSEFSAATVVMARSVSVCRRHSAVSPMLVVMMVVAVVVAVMAMLLIPVPPSIPEVGVVGHMVVSP